MVGNTTHTSVVDKTLKDKKAEPEHFLVAETHKVNNIWLFEHVHVFLLFSSCVSQAIFNQLDYLPINSVGGKQG